jgi:predicted dienelactone hydrolase
MASERVFHRLFLVGCLFLFGSEEHRAEAEPMLDPTQLGDYDVGYTTFLAEDSARGRPIYVRVWYPAAPDASGPRVAYSADNPLYPLIPDDTPFDSPTGAHDDVPAALPKSIDGGFPMVVFSHGLTGNGLNNYRQHEVLASHGFVVVAPDHTGDVLRSMFWAEPHLAFIGFPPERERQRMLDMQFMIDEMLSRSQDTGAKFYHRIDPERIGLAGFSWGVRTIVGASVGLDSHGIPPDPRVKALLAMDGQLGPLDSEDLSRIVVPVLVFTGDQRIGTAAEILANATGRPNQRLALQIEAEHLALSGDTGAWAAELLDKMAEGHDPDLCFSTESSDFCVDHWAWGYYNPVDSVLKHSPASIFEGHDPAHIEELGFDPDAPVLSEIPLGIPRSELARLKTLYTVAFFEKHLADNNEFSRFMNPGYAESKEPDVDFWMGALSPFPRDVQLVAPATVINGADAVNIPGAIAAVREAMDNPDAPRTVAPTAILWDGDGISSGRPGAARVEEATVFPNGGDDEFSTGMFGEFLVDDGDNTPNETLLVTFGLFSDDGSALHIVGEDFVAKGNRGEIVPIDDGVDMMLQYPDPTGNSNTFGTISLEEGVHAFEAFHYENSGDAGLEIWFATGDHRDAFVDGLFYPLSVDASPTSVSSALVPEPSAFLLAAVGLIGLFGYAKWQRCLSQFPSVSLGGTSTDPSGTGRLGQSSRTVV